MNERLQLILACIRVGRANVLTTRDIAKNDKPISP